MNKPARVTFTLLTVFLVGIFLGLGASESDHMIAAEAARQEGVKAGLSYVSARLREIAFDPRPAEVSPDRVNFFLHRAPASFEQGSHTVIVILGHRDETTGRLSAGPLQLRLRFAL